VDEVAKLLPDVFKRQVRRAAPPLVEVLTPLWSQAVGPAIAQQSRPEAFTAGTLTLAAADPVWARTLTTMAEVLRQKVNAYLGAPVVRAVRIRQTGKLELPSSWGAAAAEVPRPIPAPAAGTEALEKLDPETARAVRLSYAKYFARNRSGAA